jgi:hypothetical protein
MGAETREQRTRSDLERTDHGETLFTAAENQFGEVSNSGALVSNWRHERVCWVHNYIAEPRVCSIYSALERWPANLRWRGGGRREKGALAQAISGFHRGELTDDDRVG